jgi:hypothetical protein
MKRFFLLLLAAILGGCGQQMALSPNATTLENGSNSIALFTIQVNNQVNPLLWTYIDWVRVEDPISADSANAPPYVVGQPVASHGNGSHEYLVSVALPPGHYRVGLVHGNGQVPFLVYGQFEFPDLAEFTLPAGKVVYVGHTELTNRPRNSGEQASGGWFEPINQVVTGFVQGTMDVSVADHAESDIAMFRAAYPCLKDAEIEKAIMVR